MGFEYLDSASAAPSGGFEYLDKPAPVGPPPGGSAAAARLVDNPPAGAEDPPEQKFVENANTALSGAALPFAAESLYNLAKGAGKLVTRGAGKVLPDNLIDTVERTADNQMLKSTGASMGQIRQIGPEAARNAAHVGRESGLGDIFGTEIGREKALANLDKTTGAAIGQFREAAGPAGALESAPKELPVINPGAKTGDPHALFAYNDNFGPEGAPRSVYNIYGDPGHPAIQEAGGFGSSVPRETLEKSGIPITGREPRSVGKWEPLEDLSQSQKVLKFDPSNPPKSENPITAVKLEDGTVFYDPEARIHADLINKGVDPARVVDGGFIVDGEYHSGGADAARIGRQARAREAINAKRAASSAEPSILQKAIEKVSPKYAAGVHSGEQGALDKAIETTKQILGDNPSHADYAKAATALNKFATANKIYQPTTAATDLANAMSRENDARIAQVLGSDKAAEYLKSLSDEQAYKTLQPFFERGELREMAGRGGVRGIVQQVIQSLANKGGYRATSKLMSALHHAMTEPADLGALGKSAAMAGKTIPMEIQNYVNQKGSGMSQGGTVPDAVRNYVQSRAS